MDIGSLFNKLIENDKNGIIFNELIEQGMLNTLDIVNYVCSNNNFEYILYVAEHLDNIDINRLEDKVFSMNNSSLIVYFARNCNKINVSKFEDKLIELGDAKAISSFAINMNARGNSINVSKLEDKILEIGDASSICEFTRFVKNINILRFESFIIEKGDPLYIYEFASIVKNISNDILSDEDKKGCIDRLTMAIINTNDIQWISIFASIMKTVSIDNIVDIIIKNISNINYHNLVFVIDAYDKKYTDEIIMKVISHFEVDFVYNVLSRFYFHLSDDTIDYLFELVLSKSLEIDDMTFVEMLLDYFVVDDKKKMKKIKDTFSKFNSRKDGVLDTKVKKKIFIKSNLLLFLYFDFNILRLFLLTFKI